jgi:uncharacterized membrane protein YcjF (UPF0283 family)
MSPDNDQRSRALWRRQLVLTVLAVVAFASVAGITQIALSDWGRSPGNRAEALAMAAVVGIAVIVLLGAACLHALRIAQLVLRRGETD